LLIPAETTPIPGQGTSPQKRWRGPLSASTPARAAEQFQGTVRKYNLAKSLFAGNRNLYGSGGGPPVNFKSLETSVLELPSSSKVIEKPVEIELDQSKRNYLHVVAGTPGSEIAAGLFAKRM